MTDRLVAAEYRWRAARQHALAVPASRPELRDAAEAEVRLAYASLIEAGGGWGDPSKYRREAARYLAAAHAGMRGVSPCGCQAAFDDAEAHR